MQGLLITAISPGSPAERAGLKPGQRLLAIDGSRLRDLIDYSWLIGDDELELIIAEPDGELHDVWLEAEPGEPPGLTFAPPEPKRCGNNCIFCFVHQLPKGLRRPLYVKDEDYRLSFLQGTYVTLSNLKPSELKRIIAQRLSPLYISVHAVDPTVREKLLGRKGIPPILEQLRSLTAGRIELHTQVVLCPGINDGAVLEETVYELAALSPAIRSLAVVPVGLTEHRQHLPQLTPVDQDYAAAFLATWLPRMRSLNKQLGNAFLQLADEFFLKAGQPVPALREYGDLPQWENGVGMVAWFLREASQVLKRAKPLPALQATVVTGYSAIQLVEEFVQALAVKTGCDLTARAVPNNLFGSSVTVTGLVSGKDILAELRGKPLGDLLLVPAVMLKEGEGCFLDDLTPQDLSREFGVPVLPFEATPAGLLSVLRSYARRKEKRQCI